MSDIEMLEDYIEALRKPKPFKYTNEQKAKAIENLINKNKELEEENKILKNKQTKIIADSFHEKMAEKFDKDFIPKSKLIEALDNGISTAKCWGCEDGAYYVKEEFERLGMLGGDK